MRLREWASLNGVTYRTAWEHFRKGLIKNAYKLPTGVIVIPEKITREEYVVTYARVSSSENKKNLDTQSDRVSQFCNAKGWIVKESIKEVGSGLNDRRTKLLKILTTGKATKIVVEHKDRVARFGVEYIIACCHHFQCELIIINETTSDRDDLMEDFVAVITSFCARLYGQRRNKRRTEKLIKELSSENK